MSLTFGYASDLHIDIGTSLPEFPGGKLLVLAGDTCEARNLGVWVPNDPSRQPDAILTNRERISKFLYEVGQKYEHVVIIAGNHEHYHSTFHKTIQTMKDKLPANFRVLEKDAFELDGVIFFGATLWTDCHNHDPMAKMAIKDMMEDFKVIKYKMHSGQYRAFAVDDSIADHYRALEYFKAVLTNPSNADKKIVLVVHHAPTHKSIDARYAAQYLMNGGFYTKLDDFILDHPQIQLIIHGHTHSTFDYMVGDTRVVCNPRGYHSRNREAEYTGWDPTRTITL